MENFIFCAVFGNPNSISPHELYVSFTVLLFDRYIFTNFKNNFCQHLSSLAMKNQPKIQFVNTLLFLSQRYYVLFSLYEICTDI